MRRKFFLFIPALAISWFTIKEQVLVDQKTFHPLIADVIMSSSPSQSPTPTFSTIRLPEKMILEGGYQVFQSFNNCGPASLSMLLSYFDIYKSQEHLGEQLRPYQIANGDNDDKSVTMDEIAIKAKEFGLIAFHRPNGNIQLLKQFIASDIPVLTRTWLDQGEDIGHYRIVKGFDDTSWQIIQDDSFQNKNLRFSYPDFEELWKKFNYEYVVLVPKTKQSIAEKIIGENLDIQKSWTKAVDNSKQELDKDPDDIYARFNLSVAFYNIGDYKNSVTEFEKIQQELPLRTLWYQIEPIKSYYQLGDYQKVFLLTNQILNNQNRAYSEAYILRGQSYLKMGKKDEAKQEFEKAVFYNNNLKAAQEALQAI